MSIIDQIRTAVFNGQKDGYIPLGIVLDRAAKARLLTELEPDLVYVITSGDFTVMGLPVVNGNRSTVCFDHDHRIPIT